MTINAINGEIHLSDHLRKARLKERKKEGGRADISLGGTESVEGVMQVRELK